MNRNSIDIQNGQFFTITGWKENKDRSYIGDCL